MDIHQHAKTTPQGRLLMVRRLADGWTVTEVAAALGVTARTVRKWQARHVAEGEAGLRDRSSRPLASPTRLGEAAEAEILALRRQRLTGPAIARRLGRPGATVGLVLRRHGLGRLAALDAKPEIVRYQRERPGELIHLDIKKLGKIDGVGHRITGDLKHKRTRPYTPRTNGKAERFIQTSLREWAYLQAFASSAERTEAMRPWLHGYNRWRPHSALAGKPPLSRLPGDNLHSNDS